jgi:hypothetical protein
MSAPNANESYAPNGYDQISPGHYRRRQDDPEAEAAERAGAAVNFESDDPFEYITPSLGEFRKLAKAKANPLDEIATRVRLLTYGEMMDLAAALWQMRPEGKEVTEQELPGMLHRWSAS